MSVLSRQSVLAPKLPIENEKRLYWSRLYGSAKSLIIANTSSQMKNPVVVITKDVLSAVNLANELQQFVKNTEETPIKFFPDWETLPYDIYSPYQLSLIHISEPTRPY